MRLAVFRESVDHVEVVPRENRGELFEEVGERVACGAAVVAVGALAPLLSGVDVAEPVDKGGGADSPRPDATASREARRKRCIATVFPDTIVRKSRTRVPRATRNAMVRGH